MNISIGRSGHSHGTLRVIESLKAKSNRITNESVAGQKTPESLSLSALVLSTNSAAMRDNFQNIYNSTKNLENYILSAQDKLGTIQDQLASLATLATSALDPALQGSRTILSTQYQEGLQQLQNFTDSELDDGGNKIFSGVIANYGPSAQIFINAIVGNNDVIQAVDAGTANTALKAMGAALNLTPAINSMLDNAANIALNTTSGGVDSTLAYIAQALQIIPGIAVNSTQIGAQLTDAIRAAKIGSLLGQAVSDGIAAANVASGAVVAGNLDNAQDNIYTSIIAALINEYIPAGNQVSASPAPTGAASVNAQALRELLTPIEIQNLKSLVATGGVLDARSIAANAADGAPNPAAIFMADLSIILQTISCLKDIPLLCPLATNPATDIFGVLEAGPLPTQGNIIPGNIFAAGAIGTLTKSLTTAALTSIANAKPQIVQDGPNIISLIIGKMTPDGLRINKTDISTIIGAQDAFSLIKIAQQTVVNNIYTLNNTLKYLNARQEALGNQITMATENYDRLKNTDPLSASEELSNIASDLKIAAAMLNFDIVAKDILSQAALKMLNSISS